jgi:hypothetical protein
MVAPSAPRDARSKTPPGPEGSNGIGRCGCRGQPAGPSPFMGCAHESQSSLREPWAHSYRAFHGDKSYASGRSCPAIRGRAFAATRGNAAQAWPLTPTASPRPLTKGALLQQMNRRKHGRMNHAGTFLWRKCGVLRNALAGRSRPRAAMPRKRGRSPPRLRRAPLPRGLCSSRYAASESVKAEKCASCHPERSEGPAVQNHGCPPWRHAVIILDPEFDPDAATPHRLRHSARVSRSGPAISLRR